MCSRISRITFGKFGFRSCHSINNIFNETLSRLLEPL